MAYRAAAALRPGDAAVLRGLADVLAAAGQAEEAAAAYEAAIRLDRAAGAAGPGLAAGLAGLAGLRRAAGDTGEALRLYRAAAHMDPADGVSAHTVGGRMHMREGAGSNNQDALHACASLADE
jgi:tetratricopeptide (TPR) repeat protein